MRWVVAPRGRPGDRMGAHHHLLVWQGIPRIGQVRFSAPRMGTPTSFDWQGRTVQRGMRCVMNWRDGCAGEALRTE